MRDRQIVDALAQRYIRRKSPVAILINLGHANQDAIIRNADEVAGFTGTGEGWRVVVSHGVIVDRSGNGICIVGYLADYWRIRGDGVDDNLPDFRHFTAARIVRCADRELVSTIRERR